MPSPFTMHPAGIGLRAAGPLPLFRPPMNTDRQEPGAPGAICACRRSAMIYEITVQELAPQPTATVRVTIARAALGDALDTILPEVWQYLTGLGVTPAGPPFT